MVPAGLASVVGLAGVSGAVTCGTAGPASEPGQETSHPYNIELPPLSLCYPISLPFLPWFPKPLQISAPMLPGETWLLANRAAFCWLSSCQGLDGHWGKRGSWGSEDVTCGGSCSPERLPGPQDTACALAKAGGLKPTQAPLSQGKGESTINPGFVFRR